MSHIPGHIDTESQSTGILSPCKIKDNGELEKVESCQLIFIPPSAWKSVKEKNIGFHLLTVHCKSGDKLIAYDIVPWKDHKEAEKVSQKAFKTEESLESYFYTRKQEYDEPSKIKSALDKVQKETPSGKERQYSDVVEKTIIYVKSNDFKNIYLENGKIKDTNSVVEWLIANKNSILVC